MTSVLGAVVMPVAGGPVRLTGDAATIASRISDHQSAYQLGAALGLVSIAFYVALTGLFYGLFRPVSRQLSVLAAFFSLVGCAVGAIGGLFLLAPLEVLGAGSYSKVLSADQLHALVLMLLNLNALANHVALVFFGSFQLVLGYLIVRSTFLPWFPGALIAIAGVGWLTFLGPPLSPALLLGILVVGFVAELLLMLWLLAFGINGTRWTELAREV